MRRQKALVANSRRLSTRSGHRPVYTYRDTAVRYSQPIRPYSFRVAGSSEPKRHGDLAIRPRQGPAITRDAY